MAGQIAVDRKDSRAGAKALIQAARYLSQGMPVLFFPEGTRSPDGNLLRFQDGPFRLSLKTGTPILPVVIEGTGKLLPRNSLRFTDATDFVVRILDPVPAGRHAWADAGALRDAVHARMQRELDLLRGLEAEVASEAGREGALVS